MSSLSGMLGLMFAAAEAGICLLLAIVVLRGRWSAGRKAATVLYAVVVGPGFLNDSAFGDYLLRAAPMLFLALGMVGGGAPGALWLITVALFQDRRVTAWHFAPAVISIALLAPAYLLHPRGLVFFWIWIGWSIVLTLHALTTLFQNWRGDLVEARRRLRTGFTAIGAIGCLLFLALLARVSADRTQSAPGWVHAALSGVILLTLISASAMLMEARDELFEAPRRRPTDDADTELLARLQAWMRDEEPWRDEAFGFGRLAARLEAPEYRLRRVIHTQLGHRNFAAFVNTYRLAAAKAVLAEPGEVSIAQVAFGVGFASLSPFNRAFKDQTGLTPTAWRRQMLGEKSNPRPIEEGDET